MRKILQIIALVGASSAVKIVNIPQEKPKSIAEVLNKGKHVDVAKVYDPILKAKHQFKPWEHKLAPEGEDDYSVEPQESCQNLNAQAAEIYAEWLKSDAYKEEYKKLNGVSPKDHMKILYEQDFDI